MRGSLHYRMTSRTSRTLALGVFVVLTLLGASPALSQQDGQEMRYLVVWKSRYNDKDYRSQWFYGDPALADSVAGDLRQFHAFRDVRVITVPIVLSPDGISGKIAKNAQVPDSFNGRGTGAFTVSDLWNYGVPGGSGGGDPQVISLRRADSATAFDAGASNTRPSAPVNGEKGGGRLVYREDTPKGQKAGTAPTSKTGAEPKPKTTLGANEKPVKEEILRAKSEVLQTEKRRLDEERSRINQATARGDTGSKDQLNKYRRDLKDYSELVGQYQKDRDSHQARFDPIPAPPRTSIANTPAELKESQIVGRTFLTIDNVPARWRFDADHTAQLILDDGREAMGHGIPWAIKGDLVVLTYVGGSKGRFRISGRKMIRQ